MSSDDTRRFGRVRNAISTGTTLASTYAKAKSTQWQYRANLLQKRLDTPESYVEDKGVAIPEGDFDKRVASRDELKEYHKIRLDGGVAATMLEARALMVFGVGAQFTADVDAPANWLNTNIHNRDLLTLDIGTDALFYGYSLGETRETVGGEYGKTELIEPWTTVPRITQKGEIVAWEQEIKEDNRAGKKHVATFDPEDVHHFSVSKSSGRDPVGMSMLGQSMSEVNAYRENQQAIQNAVKLHGFPKWHVKLGREDGAVIDDNELRRARPQFDDINELTKWVTGQDVDIDTISPEGFEFEQITEHDLSKIAISFMLPVEISQVAGGDGLGTGFPAKLRKWLFTLSAKAQQKRLGADFVDYGEYLLREYSPFADAIIDDLDLEYTFEEPITDLDELKSQVDAIGTDMTVNERRGLFDEPPLDDDEIGESFDSPGVTEPEPFGGDSENDAALQDQEGNPLAAQVLRWLSDFGKSDNSIDDPLADYLTWVEEFADEPNHAIQRSRVAISLFAADQGTDFDSATTQPAANLVRWLEANRNLAEADADIDRSAGAVLSELDVYRDGFEAIVWADLEHDLAGPSFTNDGDVPANVRNRLDRAADKVSWSDTEGVPPGNLKDFFVNKLSQPQGWSIDSLANGLRSEFGARLGEPDERVNIARTKSAALLNQAKRMAFEDLEEGIDGDLLYYWDGPSDEDTTDACAQLKELTNPEHGGQPRPRREFDTLMEEIRTEFFPEFETRGDAIHWQERHQLDAMLPSEANVDPAGVGGMATAPGDD